MSKTASNGLEDITSSQIALIGIGNIMFCDEGIGHYALKAIEANYKPHQDLILVDGGVLGFSLMSYLQTYNDVILISTSSKDEPIGSIFIEDMQDVINNGFCRKTANEVELAMMLEICAFSTNVARISTVSIVPHDIISVCNRLSPPMMDAFESFVTYVVELLESKNIYLEKKEQTKSLEAVINDCANPKHNHFYS